LCENLRETPLIDGKNHGFPFPYVKQNNPLKNTLKIDPEIDKTTMLHRLRLAPQRYWESPAMLTMTPLVNLWKIRHVYLGFKKNDEHNWV
jgi:hypothetical protein